MTFLSPLNLLRGPRRVLGWYIRTLRQSFGNPTVRLDYLCSVVQTEIGDYGSIGERSVLYRCQIGKYTYCGSNCRFSHTIIGNFSSIGCDVKIGLWPHPLARNVSTHPIFYSQLGQAAGRTWVQTNKFQEDLKTSIGSDVWIGDNVLIKSGIKIGNGSVIGAGAVVTKDIAPYTIVAGIPAREIRKRFPAEIISKLESVKWWNWEDDKIRENVDIFDNIDNFLSFTDKS